MPKESASEYQLLPSELALLHKFAWKEAVTFKSSLVVKT